MDSLNFTDCGCNGIDPGPVPFTANMIQTALQNQNFRTAVWTGTHLQWTVMCIPVCGEIGLEMHSDTDQLIRIEQGQAVVRMGPGEDALTIRHCMRAGDAVLVPCGTWHNVINTGNCPLKLSSLYAPTQHPRETVHKTKADAEKEE